MSDLCAGRPVWEILLGLVMTFSAAPDSIERREGEGLEHLGQR